MHAIQPNSLALARTVSCQYARLAITLLAHVHTLIYNINKELVNIYISLCTHLISPARSSGYITLGKFLFCFCFKNAFNPQIYQIHPQKHIVWIISTSFLYKELFLKQMFSIYIYICWKQIGASSILRFVQVGAFNLERLNFSTPNLHLVQA